MLKNHFARIGRVLFELDYSLPEHYSRYGWLYTFHVLPYLTLIGNYNKSIEFGWLFFDITVSIQRELEDATI